jgi:hypothetical protein
VCGVAWRTGVNDQEVLWRGVKEIKRVVLELREYTYRKRVERKTADLDLFT